MVATGAAGAATNAPADPAEGNEIPFFYGSNLYVQKIANGQIVQTLDADQHEFSVPVTAGGFLRGGRAEIRSKNGVLGAATVQPDAPWSVINSIKLENVNGGDLMYPMGGYAYYVGQRFFRPWYGDPAKRWDYAATANPAGTLFIQPEIRHTAGVLANTDARSQYRLAGSIAPISKVLNGAPTTAPQVTVTFYAEIWAQPDASDLHGTPIQKLPPGLAVQTLRRHQTIALAAASTDNQLQLTNVGNEIRGFVLVVRDSLGARQDYLSDPVRWYLDDRNLGVFSPDEIFNRMHDFYPELANGTSTRPTGVYVFPRFYDPGRMVGESWITTNNATYLAWETQTDAAAANMPGTVEVITDEVVPAGAVPVEMESI